jgi:uncharacterized protein YlzI (FlbEa/FlbD family)
MKNFEIYVKTSALGKTGIHWRRIESEEHQPIEKPSLIKSTVIQEQNGQAVIVNDLIDEVKPSLIIFRSNSSNSEKKLLLEVTGIESPLRSDKLGRKVLNSIVWIASDSRENEEVLRKIAYSAIQYILGKDLTFSKMVEESIDFFQLEEFRVNLDKINEFIQQITAINNQEHNLGKSSQEKYQIEAKSSDNLETLAEEIQNNPLPKSWICWDERDGTRKADGVLVVVTENLEKRTILHLAGVWRGFASHVEEPAQKKTETIPPLPAERKPQILPQPNQKSRLIIMLLIIAIIILLILVSLPFLLQPQSQKTPQLQIQPQTTQTPQPQSYRE